MNNYTFTLTTALGEFKLSINAFSLQAAFEQAEHMLAPTYHSFLKTATVEQN